MFTWKRLEAIIFKTVSSAPNENDVYTLLCCRAIVIFKKSLLQIFHGYVKMWGNLLVCDAFVAMGVDPSTTVIRLKQQ